MITAPLVVIAIKRRHLADAQAVLVRCAINLGPEPRKLTRAPSLFVGETLYGALESGDVLPPFSAVVVRVS